MPPSTPSNMPPRRPSPPYHHLPPLPMKQLHPHYPSEPPPRKARLLRPHQPTNPLVWCGAFLCVIFSLLLILAGIFTLIVFLVIKPHYPLFETTNASLNSVYIESPAAYINGDLTFLANFSNPNRKINVVFEYLSMELYFYNRLIAVQSLQPFAQPCGTARLESVRMITSEVYLPPQLAMELEKEVIRSNRVVFHIRGTFKVRANLGFAHFTYWLYGRCRIELTGPPTGVLVARSCRTSK